MILNVDIGQIEVTNNLCAHLRAGRLGSAVTVAIHDPVARVSGLLHFVLPRWELNRKAALGNPFLFANSGIPQLFRRCYNFGAEKDRMNCYLIGGADVHDPDGAFQPGRDNVLAATGVLERNGVAVTRRWVGGRATRAVDFAAAAGDIQVTDFTAAPAGSPPRG